MRINSFTTFITLFLLGGLCVSLHAQNRGEQITITPVSYYGDLSFYAFGDDLWIDLNGNGTNDDGEAIVSGKKQYKILPNTSSPVTIYGTSITELRINDFDSPGQITAIDLTQAPSLATLDITANPIEGELDLKSCHSLQTIKVKQTNISSIDASGCQAMTHLYASGSPKLKKINVSDCSMLSWLEAEHCIIEEVILRGCTSLSGLYLVDNRLKELYIPMSCTNIKTLSISNNPTLGEISMKYMTNLTELYASRCGLKSIDISRGVSLQKIDLSANALKEITLHVNAQDLTDLMVYQNQLSDTEVMKLIKSLPADDRSTAEKRIFIVNTLASDPKEGNFCTKEAVAQAKHRGWDVYDYYGGDEKFYPGVEPPVISLPNNQIDITSALAAGDTITYEVSAQNPFVDLNGNAKRDEGEDLVNGAGSFVLGDRSSFTIYGDSIVMLALTADKISQISLKQAPSIKKLVLRDNRIETIDLSMLHSVESIDLSHNNLREVTLPSVNTLSTLDLSYNELSTITIPASETLKSLSLRHNQISSLDLSSFLHLEMLDVEVNRIDATAMGALVKSLNDTILQGKSKNFYVVDTQDPTEKNYISESLVSLATQKGWSVYNGETPNYPGQVEVKPGDRSESIRLSFGAERPSFKFSLKGIDCWIDLNMNGVLDPGEELDGQSGTTLQVSLGAVRNVPIYGKRISEYQVNEEMNLIAVDAQEARSLETLWIRENKALASITLPDSTALRNLDLSEGALTGSIDLSHYTKLEKVFLPTNHLQEIQLGTLSLLKVLSVSENQITDLNLKGCANLESCYVVKNKLSSLDCQGLESLKTLSIYGNQIKREAMKTLIEGLNDLQPESDYQPKNFTVLLVSDNGDIAPEEGNECPEELMKIAKLQKHWTVLGWKQTGGIIPLGVNQPASLSTQEELLVISSCGNGWQVKCPMEHRGNILHFYSISGELIASYPLTEDLSIVTDLHQGVLLYRGQSYLLVR